MENLDTGVKAGWLLEGAFSGISDREKILEVTPCATATKNGGPGSLGGCHPTPPGGCLAYNISYV